LSEKKIIVSCSFREFDGGEDAKIQQMFLDSIKAQTHKNVTLAVTNFHEKTVEKAISECGLDYVFFQSELDLRYYSISEVCYNAASLVTPGNSIFLHSSADHIFPPHFFETIVKRMPEMGSVTSFPQKVYDGIAAYEADESLEDGFQNLRLDRGMLKDIDDSDLPGVFAMDPNHWLPDTVAVDGDLFLQPGALDRLMDPRFIQKDISPGVAQNVLLAFLAKPGKRKNIVMEARYIELLNDYMSDARSVPGATTFAEARRDQDDLLAINWERLIQYGKDVGMEPYEYENGPFVKINQVELYEPTGTHEQKLAFQTYLNLWRMRYLVRAGNIPSCEETVSAQDHLKKSIALLSAIKPPSPIEELSCYPNIWLYGASAYGELVLGALKGKGLSVKGVADTYQTGNWAGFDIHTPDQLKSEIGAGDAIFISSDHWKEISDSLLEIGLTNHMYSIKGGNYSLDNMDMQQI